MRVQLDPKTLGNLPNYPVDPDFEFVLGNKSYSCPWHVAHLLSPKLSFIRSTDPTISSLHLSTVDRDNRFGDLLCLGACGELTIQDGDRDFFAAVLCELGNFELYKCVLRDTAGLSTISSVITVLLSAGDDLRRRFRELEFISANFSVITPHLFGRLTFPLVEAILVQQNLRLASEDSLCNLLSSRFDDDERFYSLLEYVRFEYVQTATLQALSARLFDFMEHVNSGIWRRLCGRLCQLRRHSAAKMSAPAGLFPLTAEPAFRGVISRLTPRGGPDVHESGIVRVSASSVQSGSLGDAVDFARRGALQTRPESEPWICYDFKRGAVRPAAASVLVHPEMGPCELYMDQSAQGVTWVELGRFTQTRDFDGLLWRLVLHKGVFQSRFLRIRAASEGARELQLWVLAWEVMEAGDVADAGGRPAAVAEFRPPIETGRFHELEDQLSDGIAAHLAQLDARNVVVSWSIRNGQNSGRVGLAELNLGGIALLSESDYVQLEFPNHRVDLTHYAVRIKSAGERPAYRWGVSIWVKDRKWKEVDVESASGDHTWTRRIGDRKRRLCSRVRFQLKIAVRALVELRGFEVFGSIVDHAEQQTHLDGPPMLAWGIADDVDGF
jgi:hypothetical protein